MSMLRSYEAKNLRIIIPDIHERMVRLNAIDNEIANRKMGKIQRIYLGDWFDSFKTNERGKIQTINRLMKEHEAGSILLWGNHDYHYHDPHGKCSGYSAETQSWIDQMLPGNWPEWFVMFHYFGDFLFSHAGFNSSPMGFPMTGDETLLRAVGRARGGTNEVGGPLWLDWDQEFLGMGPNGWRQIVGHTPHSDPRILNGNICLDTGLCHFAIVSNKGEVEIVKVG